MSRSGGDRGAVFPLYIWMVSGLLLISLILFVFAQAAFTRSGGQSAADAAALAAAQQARDQLYDDFLDAVDGDGDLEDILEGEEHRSDQACDAASDLAARNDADLISCAAVDEPNGYRVDVETRRAVGESVIPGTSEATASAAATALIEGRCSLDSAEEGRVELLCDDETWDFDPGDAGELPDARDLYRVHLED